MYENNVVRGEIRNNSSFYHNISTKVVCSRPIKALSEGSNCVNEVVIRARPDT